MSKPTKSLHDFFRLLVSFLLCVVLVSGCIDTDPIVEAVEIIDKGIEDIRTASADWQTVLQRVADQLPRDISEVIRTDAQNLATRSIALAGVEFRCGIVDFLQNRAIRGLQHLKAKLLNQTPPPLPPEFCQVSPDAIELNTVPDTWSTIVLTGYDLDYTDSGGQRLQILLLNDQNQTTTLPESRIGRTTHYQVTLNLGNMARDIYNNKIVKILVQWNNSTELENRPLPQVVIIPWTPRRESVTINPGRTSYMPPHTGGDKNFNTHDDEPTTVRVIGQIQFYDFRMLSRVFMQARENEPDHTKVEGWSNWAVAYDAPEGWKIVSVLPDAISDYTAKVTTHGVLYYHRPSGEVVKVFSVWVDRDGDEAGTWTRIEAEWRELRIVLEEIAPEWLR